MPKATVDEVAQGILALLPDDGTPVANQRLASIVARRIGKQVTLDLFYEAHQSLLSEGKAARTGDAVGGIYKEAPITGTDAAKAAVAVSWPEKNLMGFLSNYLEGPFKESLQVHPTKGVVEIKDTSTAGNNGIWSRPDFVVACADELVVSPGCRFDVHSFELKREDSGGMTGVHEALAQTRSTHYGHLVWHLPEKSDHEVKLDETMRHCNEHGIGLVRMRNAAKAATNGCEVLLHPRRKATAASTVDAFLANRLKTDQLERLRRVTRPSP